MNPRPKPHACGLGLPIVRVGQVRGNFVKEEQVSTFLQKTGKVALGIVVGVAVVVFVGGCGDVVRPAVAKVSPEVARPGATMTVEGKGLIDQVVTVGDVEVHVKKPSTDSFLVIELPQKLKPGSYDLVVTDKGTKISSKPVAVRILDLITLPAGTPLKVRVAERIHSGISQVGDTFLLSFNEALVVQGRTIAAEGSEVVGKVTQVEEAGRVKGRAEIEFTLIQFDSGKNTYAIATDTYYFQAQSTQKRDAATIGGGAGIGAVVGGLIGGKKGAIIGAGAGGAAGTVVVLATQGNDIESPFGALFSFLLRQDVEIDMGGPH